MWGSAISGGIFGLLGGYLTDRFGRRRVLTWSILVYAISALASGFSTSPAMLLVLRCTTFIGVCVEFVAAVAWLAELFPNPHQREAILGYTQAFSSFGGLLGAGIYFLIIKFAGDLPAIFGEHVPWRYLLISGVIPALPLIFIRPFLPESPAWQQKKVQGTLKRPSIVELFRPAFRRTSLVTAALFACGFGAAFGAIQWTPQLVPALALSKPEQGDLVRLRKQYNQSPSPEVKQQLESLQGKAQKAVANVQMFQEVGGLLGRFFLAWLAVRIVSRRKLLRIFLVPGLILIPLVFLLPAAGRLPSHNLDLLRAGIFVAGFLTIAQFSYWGNYLPRVYPTYLRGTGESFAANIGGRMVGTAANPLTAALAPLLLTAAGGVPSVSLAYAAAAVAFLVYALANIFTFWLPEPKAEALLD
jgi:MFS family permease